ncbi:hypothetical protein [Paenibacillus harenae]|uniref:hypothetical protein n=1 Tax=Paenibacillus harenae TaxID=306543 RepID=UPI0027941188|nr:hypothetical protein [Paenibacillus harenae]MDQ0063021.1 hypothetical protein [Paenibacillus harenae]
MKRTGFISTKLVAAFLLSFSLLFTQATAFAATPETVKAVTTAPASVSAKDGAAQYKQFLQEKYDIQLSGKVTKGQLISAVADIFDYEPSGKEIAFTDLAADEPVFNAAAALYEKGILAGPSIQADGQLTNYVAVAIALRAADLKELALTYPAAKADSVLAKLQVKKDTLSAKAAQEVAAAFDTGLLPASLGQGFKPNAPASDELIHSLLGQVLITKGLYKKYIGYTSDSDIYAKLSTAYETSDLIDAPKLQKLVNTALEQELVTGYSIKDTRFEANFIDSLSLIYGHSDFKHALQLIGLLRSEGIDAKVQFEPKTSAFLFLADWGDPGPNVVKIANGNYIAFAKEYDLAFEFTTTADKAAFDGIIEKYAKKNAEDQQGLIFGSWWQPLYYSNTELAGYEQITNNLISDPDSTYTVNSFSLKEDSAKVVQGFKAIDPDAVITPFAFWVDKPFFRYLHGEAA